MHDKLMVGIHNPVMGAPTWSGAGAQVTEHIPEGMTVKLRHGRLRTASQKRPEKNVLGRGNSIYRLLTLQKRKLGIKERFDLFKVI